VVNAKGIGHLLQEFDDTLVQVIASVHRLQLALVLKVPDDLALRGNLPRDAPCIFPHRIVNEIAQLARHRICRGHDRFDYGSDEPWRFRTLLSASEISALRFSRA
jgi:hypothetical protein